MDGKKINITIGPTGACKVDTVGFKGASCQDATKIIETALSESKAETTTIIKEEWFQQEDHAGGIHIEQGQKW